VIELRDVSFGYGDRFLFQGVNLTVRKGEIVLIRGKSGCGKTSFLCLLNRFRDPMRGEILLDGRPYGEVRYPELRRKVIYLHQAPVMMPGLSVRENLRLPFSFRQNQNQAAPDAGTLAALLTDLHLTAQTLERDAESLSLGEQQRMAVLRASLVRPDFLLLDEPLANLDPESAQVIQHWIAGRSREDVGLVVVSHQPLSDLPAGAARALEIRGGAVVEHRG
jgi:putative ABC transport system ATP-binding protein